MRQPLRRGMVLSALLASGAAAYFAPPPPDDVASPVPHQHGARAASSEQTDASTPVADLGSSEDAQSLRPRQIGDETEMLSAFLAAPPSTGSTPLPAPTQSAVEPPIPTIISPPLPPPLPFRVAGRISDVRGEAIFVVFNEQNLVVHVGESIGPDYEVTSIAPDLLTFLYKPLHVDQTIALTAIQ